jgi:hypothetical protein
MFHYNFRVLHQAKCRAMPGITRLLHPFFRTGSNVFSGCLHGSESWQRMEETFYNAIALQKSEEGTKKAPPQTQQDFLETYQLN